MTPLPMTVIGGYLGAGKTTLINRLLAEDHGLRILVLVNDFGAINIDASLLISADEDTIELANGCVCCTMGADLFLAIGDVLDRSPRPDHLIVEASGIADPVRIANVAKAEPDLTYAGIVTVVDGTQATTLLSDTQIAPQIAGQIACADLLVVSKTPATPDLLADLKSINPDARILPTDTVRAEDVLLSNLEEKTHTSVPHATYAKWSYTGTAAIDHDVLVTALTARPDGLYRVKGHVRGTDGTGFLVQVAGADIAVSQITMPDETQLVGIGLASRLSAQDCETWWHRFVTPLSATV